MISFTVPFSLRKYCLVVLVIALAVAVPAAATAQGVPPHRFAGQAYVDGELAAAGTEVEAVIGGETVAETTVNDSGFYVLSVVQPVGSRAITFRVDGRPAGETATWTQGERSYPFDLSVESGSSISSANVPPHAFVGKVTIDGRTARAGITVSAMIDGEVVATVVTTTGGRYKLRVGQGPEDLEDEVLTFTADGLTVEQTGVWRQGGVDILDLIAWNDPRDIATMFEELIDDESLVTVWMYQNPTQSWSLFDPRPEIAWANDLTEVSTGDILWVEVSDEVTFQGETLYEGWNLVALR